MTIISAAAIEWLDYHQMGMNALNRQAVRYGRSKWKLTRDSIDPTPDNSGYHWAPHDSLMEDGRHWLLDQRLGRLRYRELKTGHGKLVIMQFQLAETLCVALKGKGIALEQVVELPDGAMIRNSGATVIRARNLDNGDLELLLRVQWFSVAAA